MEFTNLLYNVDNGIAVVTINRPKALNALNGETIAELAQVFDHIRNDDDVKGVILTGSGSKSFVAGADISELAKKNPLTARELSLVGQATFNKIEQLPKPVIAAVNGFALGGGCELSMACHMRVAAKHAKFGQPEVTLGVIPGYGGTQRLPRLVGKGVAMELLLSGGMIGAGEAHRIGLVNRVIEAYKMDEEGNPFTDDKGRPVFDPEAFIEEAVKMLKGILKQAPLALAYSINAVNRGLDADFDSALAIEADLFGMVFATEDKTEGIGAFLEKRKAEFKGK